MNAFERIILYYSRAFKHWRWLWLFHIVADMALLVFARDYWYLVSVIVLGDLIRLAANGAWHCAKKHETAQKNPAKDPIVTGLMVYKTAISPLIAIWAANHEVVACMPLYLLVFFNTIETMRRVLLVMQKFDPTWLKSTAGTIGTANWMSICRIGLSVILPHLFWVRPFGSWNAAIELVLLSICFITDAIDGKIARSYNMETRAGRYLDPLGDKILFVPLAIAFALMTGRFNLTGNKACFGIITIICVSIAIVRDILFFIWFFTWRKKGPRGMRAGKIDKIRMVVVCFWLGAMAIAYAYVDAGNAARALQFVSYSFILVMLVMIASLISFIVDVKRFNRARKVDVFY